MKKRHNDLWDKLIGLGEDSLRKSYYPELQRKIQEVEESKEKLLRAFNEKREFMRNVLHELRTPIHGLNSLIYLLRDSDLNDKQKTLVDDSVTTLIRLENLIGEVQKLANSGVFGTDSYVTIGINDLIENIISPVLSRESVGFRGNVSGDIPIKIVAKKNELHSGISYLCEYGTEFSNDCVVKFEITHVKESSSNIELNFKIILEQEFLTKAHIARFYSQVFNKDSSGDALKQSESELFAFGGIYNIKIVEGGTEIIYKKHFEYFEDIENEEFEEEQVDNVETPNEYGKIDLQKILVVEDNDINRHAMEMLLEDYNYEIDMAVNGKEGYELFLKNDYVLIFMDIKMPIMSGDEAIQRIRRDEEARGTHVPIVAMTAFAMMGDKEKYRKIGADEYLPKPFEFDEFQRIIDKYITEREVA